MSRGNRDIYHLPALWNRDILYMTESASLISFPFVSLRFCFILFLLSFLHFLYYPPLCPNSEMHPTAKAIAGELGIDEIYADLKPEDKVAKVRELAERYGHVAMVGDGVNDAPALAEATMGVAMGAAGTDVALETADVALMADDLEKLAYALKLARRNQAVVNQNLALSAVVIGVLVIGAVAGWFTLPIAVLGHEISEFVVIGSGLRMLRA